MTDHAVDAASCPKSLPGAKNGLPNTATVRSPDRLVPDEPILAAVLCSYVGSNMEPMAGRPLGRHETLSGDLAAIRTDLRWEPPRFSDYSCSAVGGPETDFLLGLSYDGGVLWILSAQDPNDCAATTNGAFTGLANDGAHFAAVLKAGQWVAAPTIAIEGAACVGGNRWGQQLQMVPSGPVGLDICAPDEAAPRHITDRADIDAMAAALNAGRTTVSTQSCAQVQDPTSKQSIVPIFDTLRFSYPAGPSVTVRLGRPCHPEVDNSSLQSADATATLKVMNAILKK